MAGLIDEIRKWLSRHKVVQGEIQKEGTWFTPKDGGTQRNSGKTPLCVFFVRRIIGEVIVRRL